MANAYIFARYVAVALGHDRNWVDIFGKTPTIIVSCTTNPTTICFNCRCIKGTRRNMIILSILAAMCYLSVALTAGWIAYTVLGSELYAHPYTRGKNLQWIGVLGGSILGLLWPITLLPTIMIISLPRR